MTWAIVEPWLKVGITFPLGDGHGRGVRRTHYTIARGDMADFAPFRGRPRCVSRAGRLRERHEVDRDGRCLFCAASVDKDR